MFHCQCYGLPWEKNKSWKSKETFNNFFWYGTWWEMLFVPQIIQHGFFIGLSAFQKLHLCERLCHKKCMQLLSSRNVNSKEQSAIATVPESIFLREGFVYFMKEAFSTVWKRRHLPGIFLYPFQATVGECVKRCWVHALEEPPRVRF